MCAQISDPVTAKMRGLAAKCSFATSGVTLDGLKLALMLRGKETQKEEANHPDR